MRKFQVVVIGSSKDSGNDDTPYRVGYHIGSRGYVLITGGRGGVMEEASRGASEAGGTVVGILPWDSPDGANPHCDIVIPSGIGFARNSANVLSGDVIVAIGGASGTMSELAYAWQYGKPLICAAFTGGWSAIFSGIEEESRKGCVLHRAENCGDIFSYLEMEHESWLRNSGRG